MKLNPRRLFEPFHSHISMEWLLKMTKMKIFLPFYHTISEVRLPHISNLYLIRSTSQFIKDLDFLCNYYEPVSIDQLFKIISNQKQINRPVFHITFDDGLREFYTIIAPILEKRGIPATVFVSTNFIDNKAMCFKSKVSLIIEYINSSSETWWHKEFSDIFETSFTDIQQIKQRLLRLIYDEQSLLNPVAKTININFHDYLKKVQPYLNSKEITDLLYRGFTIGSHILDHPFFKELSINDQKNQITESFKFLVEKFNLTNKYFSFPFSDVGVDAQLFNWLYSVENCRLSFGTLGLKDDSSRFHLHRNQMDSNNKSADKLIKSEYSYYLLKAIINMNKIIVR